MSARRTGTTPGALRDFAITLALLGALLAAVVVWACVAWTRETREFQAQALRERAK